MMETVQLIGETIRVHARGQVRTIAVPEDAKFSAFSGHLSWFAIELGGAALLRGQNYMFFLEIVDPVDWELCPVL